MCLRAADAALRSPRSGAATAPGDSSATIAASFCAVASMRADAQGRSCGACSNLDWSSKIARLVSVREAETGRFVSLNRAGETMTGLTREQVVGRTWGEIYARQFADLYAELDRKALSTGTQVDRPRDVMLRADGKRLTINQRVVPLFESEPGRSAAAGDANARYVMSIIDDLTEEVRAETRARNRSKFRQLRISISCLILTAFFERAVRQPAVYDADWRASIRSARQSAQCDAACAF